jgi:hypothetical protein
MGTDDLRWTLNAQMPQRTQKTAKGDNEHFKRIVLAFLQRVLRILRLQRP